MRRIGQVLAMAPAMGGKRRIFGRVDAGFVAGIGAVLRDQRIGGDARQKGGLIEVHERGEGRERLRAIVDVGAARVQRVIGRPRLWREGAPVGADLEQFVARLEGLPDARAGVAERLGAVGFAAMGGVGQGGQLSAMKARQAKASKSG